MALTSAGSLPLQKQKVNKMPVVSEAQRKYFKDHAQDLQNRGVNVDQETQPMNDRILPPSAPPPKKRLTFGQRIGRG